MNFNEFIHYGSTNIIMQFVGKNNNIFGLTQLKSHKITLTDFNNEFDTHDECHKHEHEHCTRTSNEGFRFGDLDLQ